MKLDLTFVTPTYNAAVTIEDTLRSVAQEAAGFHYEHLVIDGKSTDATIDVVRRFDHPSVAIVSEPDRGVYDAMNKGIAAARGRWIAILNADDYYAPGAVARVMQIAAKHSDARVIHGDMLVTDGTRDQRVQPGRGLAVKLALAYPINHPTMFARDEVYRRHGGYDLSYKLAADQEFFLRLVDAGERLHYLPEVQTVMRAGGLSGRHYDTGTLELLNIYKRRRSLLGRASAALFYRHPRLRNHPEKPRDRWRYWSWAVHDFLGG